MNRWMARVAVVLVMMSVGSAASAQMGKDGTGKPGMMGDGMMGSGGMGMPDMMGMHGPGMGMDMGGGMMDMMKMMKAVSSLNLTPEQNKKLQMVKLQHQKEAIPLLGKIRMAGVDIQELLLADSVDLAKVKAKVREKHEAMADLDISHLVLMRDVKAVLSPEQRQRMESMMMEMGPMPMMGPMMAPPSGNGKNEGTPQAAPGAPGGSPPKTDDPHGH